jgi:hypothetical protein
MVASRSPARCDTNGIELDIRKSPHPRDNACHHPLVAHKSSAETIAFNHRSQFVALSLQVIRNGIRVATAEWTARAAIL